MSGSTPTRGKLTGGIGEAPLAGLDQEPLGGTGGSSGSGTRSGAGEPSGGAADRRIPEDAGIASGDREMAESSDEEIARAARALGSVPGSLADAAAEETRGPALAGGAVGAEAVGAGAGRGEAGSGSPRDQGELGGGEALGQHGGASRAGSDAGN
jgi:hypothetical protein